MTNQSKVRFTRPAILAAGIAAFLGLATQTITAVLAPKPPADESAAVDSIDHIVIIYQENWTFDGLYGNFPGAEGRASATLNALTQIDRLTGNSLTSEAGQAYNNPAFNNPTTTPPPPLTSDSASGAVDARVSAGTNTVLPYSLSTFISPTTTTGDIYHRYWQEQFQLFGTQTLLNNGTVTDVEGPELSTFLSWSDNPGLTMSYYDATSLPEGLLAQQYTICDHFHHSAFGGSFLNHQFFIAAAAPVYDQMPTTNNGNIAYLDPNGVFVTNCTGSNAGRYVRDGSITPVVGDKITVTYNGASTSVTVTADNAHPYGAPNITFDKHYVVNTTRSVNLAGNGEKGTPPFAVTLLPSQNDSNPNGANGDTRPYNPTIGDVLSRENVSWKWYSGGWTQILSYSGSNPTPTTSPSFSTVNASLQLQYHHQPFAYFDNYAPFDTTHTVPHDYVGGFAGTGTVGLKPHQNGVTRAQNSAAHLQDETNFFTDVQNNTLPAVSFIKPAGVNNEHPGYAALQTGQAHVAQIVQALQAQPSLWAHTMVIVTYDEHGGRWDHVPAPAGDIWGPGARVPCLVISPLAKKGFVDHQVRDTTSILSTIEQRFNLHAINERDAAAPTLFATLTALDVAKGAFAVDHQTNQITQPVVITNRSDKMLKGPIDLALDNLPLSVRLVNASGVTTSADSHSESPYITVADKGLAPGASASVTLVFSAPASGGITYYGRPFIAQPGHGPDDKD